MSYCGGVKEVFETNKKDLAKIPKLGSLIVSNMNRDLRFQGLRQKLSLFKIRISNRSSI